MSELTEQQRVTRLSTLANSVAIITKTVRKYSAQGARENIDTFYDIQGGYIAAKLSDAIVKSSRSQ